MPEKTDNMRLVWNLVRIIVILLIATCGVNGNICSTDGRFYCYHLSFLCLTHFVRIDSVVCISIPLS